MNTIRPCYMMVHEILLDEIETLKLTSNFNEIDVVVENNFVDTTKKTQYSKFYLKNIVIVILVVINTYHALAHPSIVNTIW